MSSSKHFTANTVFVVSMLCCAGIGIWGILDPAGMTGIMLGFTTYSLFGVSWAWLFDCTRFLILATYMAFGPYGHIRLGRDDEEPEFSTVSWVAMLFADGMGSGLLLWGAAEPLYHYISPPGAEGGTAAAARQTLVITNLTLELSRLVHLRHLGAGHCLFHLSQGATLHDLYAHQVTVPWCIR